VTARAAGVTALVLASSSVSIGLLMSAGGRKGAEWRTVHEWLSISALVAVGVHTLALLVDPWLTPGLSGVAIPFVTGYRPAATALGIISAYGLLALGLSYYARSKIGPARWRRLHRWTALFWVMAIAHGLLAGTDAMEAWYLALTGAAVAPAASLLIARLLDRPSSMPMEKGAST